MSSYFEKLTSMNGGGGGPMSLRKAPELAAALNRIDELRDVNAKLEVDLKCECDEKADLVSLKVGLENEVLNLREVNDRLEFQVQQLRVEKDKIHNALARVREELGAAAASCGGAQFRKFPSLDDLSFGNNPSPPTSPTPMIRLCVTPTQAPLERITEEDETLLESLVAPNHNTDQQAPSTDAVLLARIASLESENRRLLSAQQALCLRCNKTKTSSSSVSLDEDGLVLVTGDNDDEFQDDGFEESKQKEEEVEEKHEGVEDEINVILDMQRKIIEKLETELNSILLEEDPSTVAASVSSNVSRLKLEVERKMGDIIRIVKGEVAGKTNKSGGGGDAADEVRVGGDADDEEEHDRD